MLRLLSIEWIKLKSHKFFWILLVSYCLMFLIMVRGFTIFVFDFGLFEFNAYHYPEIWHRLVFLGRIMVSIVLAPIIVFIVCDEVRYSTLRKQIIDGLSEADFLIGKLFILLLLVVFSTLVIFSLGLAYGVKPENYDSSIMFQNIGWLGIYFLSTGAYLSIAMLIALVVRRAVPALIIFFLLHMVEGLIGLKLDPVLTQYLPFNAIDRLIPRVSLQSISPLTSGNALIIVVCFYLIAFNFLSWFKLKRSSL